MQAVLIAVGDELVDGTTVDTNTAFIARALKARGIDLVGHLTVPDDRSAVAKAIAQAASNADIAVVTGGLGPTHDDLTRQALADALGVELKLHPPLLEALKEFFASRGKTMSPANEIQAYLPEGAEPLPNPIGTAPGIACKLGRCRIFALPGVPGEMRRMLGEQVLPRLPESCTVLRTLTIRTFGEGESNLAVRLADLLDRSDRVRIGITASAGVISLRLQARAATAEEAERDLQQLASEIRGRLGDLIFGEGEVTLPEATGMLLRESKATVAVAESCTGGLLGELFTSVPGSSDYFLGGIIAYANRIKSEVLGVSEKLLTEYGAVSRQTALAMAAGAKRRLGATWALSTTGIAGPGGGTPEKPVGLVWIALEGPSGAEAFRYRFPGDRETVRLRAALCALNYLRLALLAGGR